MAHAGIRVCIDPGRKQHGGIYGEGIMPYNVLGEVTSVSQYNEHIGGNITEMYGNSTIRVSIIRGNLNSCVQLSIHKNRLCSWVVLVLLVLQMVLYL